MRSSGLVWRSKGGARAATPPYSCQTRGGGAGLRGVAAAGLSRPRPRPRPRFDRKSFAAGCSLARQSGPCLHCSSMHTLTLLAAAGVVSCVMRCEMCHLSLSRSRSSGGTALEGTSGQWSNEPDHLTLPSRPAEPSPLPPIPSCSTESSKAR